MIVIMKQGATKEQVELVVKRIKKEGLDVNIDQGTEHIVIGLKGDVRGMQDVPFNTYEGVEKTLKISNTYKLTSREFHPGDTVVDVDGVKIGDGSFVTMAGPCSIEGLEQIRECAKIAKAGGAQILRGGAFKPRTSPYAFQGLEEEGLKRGIAGTIDEWLNAAEYIAVQDKSPVIFIERGIRTYETATRNTFDLSAVPLIKKLSHFPIIVDPSHGTGVWDLVTPMARAGVAAGADGMIVEIHPDPKNAWSDGQQSLNEENYMKMMQEVAILNAAMEKIKEIEG